MLYARYVGGNQRSKAVVMAPLTTNSPQLLAKIVFVYRQFQQNKNLRMPALWPTSRIISQAVKTGFKNVDEAKFYDIINTI